jgi:hypothetical protein
MPSVADSSPSAVIAAIAEHALLSVVRTDSPAVLDTAVSLMRMVRWCIGLLADRTLYGYCATCIAARCDHVNNSRGNKAAVRI